MAGQAQVTSIDAIEAFRSQLIIYLSKVRPTLEEVSADVLRTKLWLQNDQRRLWETELRARRKALERAQAELFGAKMSKFQEASAAQQMAVRHGLRAVREAEAKLAVLKKWDRDIENRTEPMVKPVDQLHHYLTTDMPKAVAFLAQVLKSLEAYAGVAPGAAAPAKTGPPPAPSSPEDGELPGDQTS